MQLYHLTVCTEGYDSLVAIVLSAKNEEDARKLAHEAGGNERCARYLPGYDGKEGPYSTPFDRSPWLTAECTLLGIYVKDDVSEVICCDMLWS